MVMVFGLGNEYTMALNLILTQVLKMIFSKINENVCIMLIILTCGLLGLNKFGYGLNFNIYTKYSVFFIGKEIGNKQEYSNNIAIINHYLINVCKINNIGYITDISMTVNDVTSYNIYNNIYLNINRSTNATGVMVKYTLWSYSDIITDFLNYIEQEYKPVFENHIILVPTMTLVIMILLKIEQLLRQN